MSPPTETRSERSCSSRSPIGSNPSAGLARHGVSSRKGSARRSGCTPWTGSPASADYFGKARAARSSVRTSGAELYDAARRRGTLLCYHRIRRARILSCGSASRTSLLISISSIEARAREAGFDVAPWPSAEVPGRVGACKRSRISPRQIPVFPLRERLTLHGRWRSGVGGSQGDAPGSRHRCIGP